MDTRPITLVPALIPDMQFRRRMPGLKEIFMERFRELVAGAFHHPTQERLAAGRLQALYAALPGLAGAEQCADARRVEIFWE